MVKVYKSDTIIYELFKLSTVLRFQYIYMYVELYCRNLPKKLWQGWCNLIELPSAFTHIQIYIHMFECIICY